MNLQKIKNYLSNKSEDRQYSRFLTGATNPLAISTSNRIVGGYKATKEAAMKSKEVTPKEMKEVIKSENLEKMKYLRRKLKLRVASGRATPLERDMYLRLLQRRSNNGKIITSVIASGIPVGAVAGHYTQGYFSPGRDLNIIKERGKKPKNQTRNEMTLRKRSTRLANLEAEKLGKSKLGKLHSHANRSLDFFRSKKRLNKKAKTTYKYDV
jgi:hypothetical protein